MNKRVIYSLLLVVPSFAAINVPLTVQEAIYPGSVAGVARTNEPVTVGVPLPDSAGIANTNVLGLTGASAAQFTVEAKWPDGNIKWLKVRAVVPSLNAGGTATLTLTDSGSGSFGGPSLASDSSPSTPNSGSITINTTGGACGAGGVICFTVKKSNFDVIDQVQIGATTVVSSGASQGLVVLGPSPTAAYPGNVTCSPTAGGTACTTVYSTANDATNSTCTIEENGPASAVLNCQADLNDGAGHVYMHTTTRLYFYQGSSKVRATVSLRNADLGNAVNFATAYKGIQGFELRLTPNLSGPLSYAIGAQTCPGGVCNGTISAGSGDYAYVYGSEFDWLQWGGDYINANCPANPSYNRCVKYSPLQGYSVMNSIGGTASTQAAGNFSQYPAGWADIANASGAGLEIGQYQMAGYGNESLEFRRGGNDVRIGMWAVENNTTSTSTLTPNVPYYMPYPEYSIHDVYLNFHASAPANPANDFLAEQHYLVARAPVSWYNSTGVFYYPLVDPTEETSYYTAAMQAYTPKLASSSVGPSAYQDLGASSTYYWPLTAHKFYVWSAGGSSNQSELRLSNVLNFLRRGHTGEYLNAAHFYKLVAEAGLPRSDGFSWAAQPAGTTNYYNYPAITDNNQNTNARLGMKNWVGDDMEHAHIYGIIDYYLLSGDETYKDFIQDAYPDTYLNLVSTNNMISNYGAPYTSQRTAGNNLMGIARLANFERSIGNNATATALLNRGNTIWATMLKPNLCTQSAGTGDPAGCTPNLNATSNPTVANTHGTNFDRGMTYQFGNSGIIQTSGACSWTGTGGQPRAFESIFTGPLLQGMWELRTEEGPGWADYNAIPDYSFGIMQAMHGTSGMGGSSLGELYTDNGTNSWAGNGMKYMEWIDGPSACATDFFAPVNFDAFWPGYWVEHQYLGQSQTNLNRQVTMMLDAVMQNCGGGFEGSCAEVWHYTLGRLIYVLNHPQPYSLVTVPVATFTDNGGGSYTIGWNVPASASSYRVKWGTRQIVDYIGYNPGTATWVGNPATTQNWFASTDAPGIPAPSGTTQSMTITTGVPGLTAANFMVKAYVNGSVTVPVVTPAAISMTAPAGGATLSGTVTVSANATAGAGVASVQFLLDGANLGSPVTGAGPAYSTSWNTTTASNASHVLSAMVTDAAGSTAISGGVTITVNNAAAAPVISAVSATGITNSGAAITWVTDQQADSQVVYGLTASYGQATALAAALVVNHSVALAGLTASTTYHFQVLSHNARGTLVQSSDFSFTTAAATPPASGSGTSIPLNTWTAIPSTGWPAEILNYDKSEYISSRKMHCVWGAYRQYLSSEHNNAIVCYSYAENRWQILENNGYWHSSHAPGVGHTVSIWTYISDKDSIAFQADGSGSNSPESFVGLWWWYDVGGLAGQDREFSPRPWLGVQTPLVEMMTYDPQDKKLILYDQTGTIEVCDPNTNACTKPGISGTAPPNKLTSPNMVYNSSNNTMYIWGGGQSDIYTVACTSNACTSMTGAKLAVTCTGADCGSGKPPARLAAGMAYSTKDNVIMMVGGLNYYGPTSAAFTDTWIFNPATLAWTEISPASGYPTSANYFTADRLTYDQDSNTFILMAINGYTPLIYAFPYSTPLNYGRVSNTYTPPAGSLNRSQPTASSQSWVFDPTIASAGSNVYLGWIESGANNDNSTCGQTHHPYIQSGAGSSASYLPAGAEGVACLSIDPDLSGSTNDSKLHMAVVNGLLWEAHEKINHNQSYYSAAFARYWTGSAWSGGAVGCFSGTCGNSLRQNPQALIGIGNTPTLATIEWNHNTYTPEGYIYVSQWNGTSWAALGSKLNINGSGTQALDAALATDGSNPAACWSEQVVDTSRSVVTTTPQIQCAKWNGGAWARLGAASLNQSATSWASDPTMTFMNGKFYIGWVERTTPGNTNVYVCRWDDSGCTLLGGGPLSLTPGTSWTAHPSLATDGTSLYVAWEEQSAQGQHSLGYVKKWGGSAWTMVGGALNADPINGSVEGITLAIAQGLPTAIWGELTFGNLRQAYAKQWNGSAWTPLSGGASTAPPPAVTSACDINGDGVVNAADVQLAINQALGLIPCNSADLRHNGQCSVVDVQRVVNASLGGACMVGN